MASVLPGERTLRCGRGSGRGVSGRRGADHRDSRPPAQRDGIHGPGDRRAHGGGGTWQTAAHRRPGCRPGDLTGIMDYARTIIARRVSADGKWFLRRAEEHVARYGKEHKQATRRRIIEAAGRRLKRDGIDGSGVATLMADAGLTNGAFYAHFPSKEDLVADRGRRASSANSARASARWRPAAPESSSTCVNTFRFSTATTPATAARPPPCSTRSGAATDATRRAYTDGLLVVIDDIAARLAPRRSAVGTREDAERVRPDGRDAPALPRPGRPTARRRGPRAGHPERPRAAGCRASELTRRTTGPKP